MNRHHFSWFNATTLTLGLTFLYLPIMLLIAHSVNESATVTVWGGFSTQAYVGLLQNEVFIEAAIVSIKVALLSATVATLLGTLLALLLNHVGGGRRHKMLRGMTFALLVIPGVIIGISLAQLFTAAGMDIDLGWGGWAIAVGHITFAMSYVAVLVLLRLGAIDGSLEEAALDLGCEDRPLAFRKVTLPLIKPTIVAGWLLAFVLSLNEWVITVFTSGKDAATLPVMMYNAIQQQGLSPEINVISVLLLAVVVIAVVWGVWLLKRKEAPAL